MTNQLKEQLPLKKIFRFASEHGIPLTFDKDQILFYQGHFPFGAFFLEQGGVELFIQHKNGKRRIVDKQGPGALLGVDSLLHQHPYNVTARCLAKSHIYFLPRTGFEKWMESQHR